MRRARVVVAVEAIHVPEATVIGLPGIQRSRGLENGAIALGRFDLFGDGRDDAIADFVEDRERVVELQVNSSPTRCARRALRTAPQ